MDDDFGKDSELPHNPLARQILALLASRRVAHKWEEHAYGRTEIRVHVGYTHGVMISDTKVWWTEWSGRCWEFHRCSAVQVVDTMTRQRIKVTPGNNDSTCLEFLD